MRIQVITGCELNCWARRLPNARGWIVWLPRNHRGHGRMLLIAKD